MVPLTGPARARSTTGADVVILARVLSASCLALALSPALVSANGLTEDLKARRERLMSGLTPGTMAVFWSAPARVYSRDVEYEYRQDSDLLYLTGVEQPDTILVLMPGNRTRREILFISPPDPRREHWEGHLLTKEEATALTGIATVHYAPEFERFAAAILNRFPYGVNRREAVTNEEYSVFFQALEQGQARLALRLGPAPPLDQPLTAEYQFANRVRERFFGLAITDVSAATHALRQIKTPYEQQLLTRSVAISAEAHAAGMRAARPGRFEYEVEAAIEQVYLASGAMSPGYPSIVGSGPNATILHYNASSRQMQDGDLLLVDAAASYRNLTGDITRTYPVNGRFSPAQREIYELVLAAQEAGMAAARAGNRTKDVEQAAEAVVRQGLLKLGLITDASGDQVRTWYTHGVCHWIGMDVHDVGDYKRPLAPGMAFVVEPGIYVRPEALAQLPDTPENRAFKEKVAPAVERYKHIGVRIEDSFLLTETGLERLSKAPRTIAEIEQTMRR